MQIIKLEELANTRHYITNIASFIQRPPYRENHVVNRVVNGFLFFEEGECLYEWDGGKTVLKPGSLIYLPRHSCHHLKILTKECAFHRTDFSIANEDGERIIFSNLPVNMCNHPDEIVSEKIRKMSKLFLTGSSSFLTLALLYELFDRIIKLNRTVRNSDIDSVISYIEKNFTKEIDCKKLSDISFMSKSKMYRTFKKETGVTPTEYKNNLRIEKAKTILTNNSCSIEELSDILGFENSCYFSRIFKKTVGMSPTDYRNKKR